MSPIPLKGSMNSFLMLLIYVRKILICTGESQVVVLDISKTVDKIWRNLLSFSSNHTHSSGDERTLHPSIQYTNFSLQSNFSFQDLENILDLASRNIFIISSGIRKLKDSVVFFSFETWFQQYSGLYG